MESVSTDVPIFDGHIHLQPGEYSSAAEFMKRAEEAGVFGGFIFSLAPYRYRQLPEAKDWNRRLEFILEYTSQTPGFYPFFWIDPTADDAEKQVAAAVEKGIAGFKVICSDFYPEEGMKCYSAIAETGKPLTFHCGGLWSEGISNKYNQPVNFEPLAAVPNLRFALAHFGWPWCDELVALYGKFIYLNRNGESMVSYSGIGEDFTANGVPTVKTGDRSVWFITLAVASVAAMALILSPKRKPAFLK